MQGAVKPGKSIKLWQIAVLFAVLLVGAGATYIAYARFGNSNGPRLEENQQLIPVEYGSLVNQVSTNGSLIFPNRVTLTFGTQGVVGEVLVEEGQLVEAEQVLAKLDTAAVTSLEKAVAQARVNLRDAQDALSATSDINDALEAAQTQLDSATASLANAQRDQLLAQKQWAQKLEDATEAVTTAWDAYQGVFSKYLGLTLSDDEQLAQAPASVLDTWGVVLALLFDRGLRFQDTDQGWTAQGMPLDDPSTPWSEPVVYTWMNLFPGELVATCENTPISPSTICIMKELDSAWEVVQSAVDNQDTVDLQAANALNNAEGAVSRAQNTLATAQDALSDLQEGPDPLLVALAEAELAAAQAALDTALTRLEGSTIKAPAAGVVSLVNVEAGQNVNANAPIVEIIDPTVIELDGIVDEIDVLFVREGARATVTMDALPGEVLEGTVSVIASAARNQQGVVSYPLRIQVQLPEGIQLREGLSATASIVIREEGDVLLVPIQALYGSFEQPVVLVMSNGRVEERPVLLGSSDDFWVAVREGLVEGEQVVMEATQASTSQFGFGGGIRSFQSGVTGGGGFRRGVSGNEPLVQPTPVPRR